VRRRRVRENLAMRVTAKADYAVRAAIELVGASEAAPRKADSIAVAQGIPPSFLENILNQLKSAGIVRSQRGPDGGWWLLRTADELTLADVIRAVEGPLASVRGERPEHLHYAGSAAPLQDVWIALRANIRDVLEHVTVGALAAGELPREITELARRPEAWTST
jgi:Rrf2 family protein